MGQKVRSGQRWVAIKAKSLVLLIVQTYADVDKKKILDAAQKPRIIVEIVDRCSLPQTSTYRKINSLIQSGLLVPNGNMAMKHGKIVTKYVSLFEYLEINIDKNNLSIKAKIGNDSYLALLSMMREKIVGLSKNLRSNSKRILTEARYANAQKEDSESIIPYLMKERVVRV